MAILITGARYIITLDKERRIIRDGAIAVEGDRIAAIGKSDEVRSKYPSTDEVLYAEGCIITPGLINCHLHTAQYLARGVGDNVFLPTWIHERIYPYEAELKPEETKVAALASIAEALRTGTTFIADPGSYNMEQVVEAVKLLGIRAVLARSLVDIHTPGRPIPEAMRESTDQATKAGEEFVRRYNGHADGRIKAWFSLRTERSTSSELARAVKELADRYGVGIETHVSNSYDSVNRHKEVFGGKTPLKRYHEAGILGPNLLIIHANWLTEEEVELVRRYDVKVVHCPSSAFTAGSGTLIGGMFEKMEDMGVTVALGSDTAPASNFLDMIRVGYCVIAHRDVKMDATLYPPESILEMLTIKGARALLSDGEVGSLEVGKKADLVIFDAKRMSWWPLLNPISNLIHSATGDTVRDVLVDGRIVVRGGRIQGYDEERLREEVEEAAEEVTSRAGVREYAKPSWPII